MHGGVLIAIKNTFNAEVVSREQPECCVACKGVVDGRPISVWCSYQPPKGGNYQYELPDFKRKVKNLPKKSPENHLRGHEFPKRQLE